jgi:uncharacterized protein (TIGR02099 family)
LKLLKTVARKIAYIAATLIILFALLVGAARILTPILDKHRAEFEAYATQLLDAPVTIDKVRVSWFKYQPEVSLNQVTVLGKETKQPILQVKKVSILLSIPSSIWQWKAVPSGIIVDGTAIEIVQDAKGTLSVQGFPSLKGFSDQPYPNETKFTDMLTWLSLQPRLILSDIDVRYTGFAGQQRFITLYRLNVNNNGNEHIISGKAILHQDIPTEVTVALKWEGQTVDLSKIDATLYLYAYKLSLAQWLTGYHWQNWQLKEGIASAKLWATWHQGAFKKIQSTFEIDNLNLYAETSKSTHLINRISGSLGCKQDDKGQLAIAGDDILIDLPAHLWPATSFYLALAPDMQGAFVPQSATLGFVDLRDIQPFLLATPGLLTDSMRQMLTGLNLRGELQNSQLHFATPWTDWSHAAASTEFAKLSVTPWHQYPGLDNFTGTIKWEGENGNLTFNSHRASVEYGSVFKEPIKLDELTGGANLSYDEANKAWMLSMANLSLLNSDVAANVQGTLTFPAEGAAASDISANFTLQNANHITRYLPMRTFDASLVAWLEQAFLSGEVQSGQAILKGKLVDFPFGANNGTFLISGNIKNIDFRFAPDWPKLTQVDGVLTFSNKQMIVDIAQAQTQGIAITKVHGVIPEFSAGKPQILEVQTEEIPTDFAQAFNYVQTSPLQQTIGKMFKGVDIHGPMSLKLGLTIPLSQPDKVQVRGLINMHDTIMAMTPWKLKIDKLNGAVQFTEATTVAKNLTGTLFNKPLQLDFSTIQKTKTVSVVRANFSNKIDIADLESWLEIPFSKVIKGEAIVNGQADFSLTEPLQINLHSNLAGITVDLPDQYNKPAAVARDFSAAITVQENQPLRIKLSYGNLLGAALILDKQKQQFNLLSAGVQLGNGDIAWPPAPGLYLSGQLDNLDWEKMKNYASQAGEAHLPGGFSHLSLKSIDVQVNSLNILGQNLNQVRLQIVPQTASWNVGITSPMVVGQVQIPMHLTTETTLNAQFQKLNLNASNGAKTTESSVNPKTIPAINFSANAVSYNNLPIGQVNFTSSPTLSGLNIQSLRINSSRLNLQATGDWSQVGQNNVTRLRGNISSNRVSDLLNSFGLDAHNFIASNGQLNFNLSWRNAPYMPELGSMNGTAAINLGKGRIVDIGKESGAKMDLGRMLSIFSLQTIPRRLSLDFSDVFQSGYSFDSIRGDFNLEDGDAYTKNMRIEGPVARVGIDGLIGLKNKNYDFILSVTPYVTSSLPVAATLISGPLVGLAAFAVNTVIGSQVSKATTYYYDVSGPWNNPTWESVKSSN